MTCESVAEIEGNEASKKEGGGGGRGTDGGRWREGGLSTDGGIGFELVWESKERLDDAPMGLVHQHVCMYTR